MVEFYRAAFVLLQLLSHGLALAEEDEKVCINSDCGLSDDEKEIELGLNALPVHIAAVTGQLNNIQQCGPWCAEEAPTTACRIDETIVRCQGDFYCTTTCALWNRLILQDPLLGGQGTKKPSVTCAMFKRFDGFAGGSEMAEPCDISCLLPEIRPGRYPAPTGLGLNCQKGTCLPVSSALADILPEVPAKLECPCNWFGSDCPDDWFPIKTIHHTASFGSDPFNAVVATTLTLSKEDWRQVTAGHQPGGVIRLVHRDPDNWNHTNPEHTRALEQPYALAFALEEGELQILTAPPDKSLHIQARSVAERVRSLPSGPITGGNLYVNPTIAGFFNSQWNFLLPFLDETPGIENVVLLSTGAGLSGTVSAVQTLLKRSTKIHLYHGVRRIQDLPFQDYLQEVQSQIYLTVVESQPPADSNLGKYASGIASAVTRGREQRKLLAGDSLGAGTGMDSGGKLYVQDVVEGELSQGRLSFERSVFVACGRLALLEETKDMLVKTHCGNSADYGCTQMVGQHFFTNI